MSAPRLPDDAPDAREALAWAPGRPRIVSKRSWPFQRGPHCWVRLDGAWHEAQVAWREDWDDGSIVYDLNVWLHGHGSTCRRSVYWDPVSFKPKP